LGLPRFGSCVSLRVLKLVERLKHVCL